MVLSQAEEFTIAIGKYSARSSHCTGTFVFFSSCILRQYPVYIPHIAVDRYRWVADSM